MGWFGNNSYSLVHHRLFMGIVMNPSISPLYQTSKPVVSSSIHHLSRGTFPIEERFGATIRVSQPHVPSSSQNQTGWWFGTFFLFPYLGKNNPNWLIFFRGVGQPPTRKWLNRMPKSRAFCWRVRCWPSLAPWSALAERSSPRSWRLVGEVPRGAHERWGRSEKNCWKSQQNWSNTGVVGKKHGKGMTAINTERGGDRGTYQPESWGCHATIVPFRHSVDDGWWSSRTGHLGDASHLGSVFYQHKSYYNIYSNRSSIDHL